MLDRGKKETNFEVDLLPVISLLAVCISFLLLTAVWIQIGTLDVSQAIGDSTPQNQPNPPSVSINFQGNGDVLLTLTDVRPRPQGYHNVRVARLGNGLDFTKLDRYAKGLKQTVPKLNTALILPKSNSSYDDIIRIMDTFKQAEIQDIGVSPL